MGADNQPVSGLNDFRLGADVFDGAGKPAGTLVSVLVREDGFDPKAVVVKDETSKLGRILAAERLFITDEVVVPMSDVASADHAAVHLSVSRDELRNRKPYLSYRLRQMSPGETLMREAQMLGGGLGIPDADELADKSADQIEIDKDENVMIGATGHRLGKVEDVVYDDGELAGIVLRPDAGRHENVLLPVRFISRGDDMALFVDLSQDDIAALKPFEEPPG